jgi:hypothetical protein
VRLSRTGAEAAVIAAFHWPKHPDMPWRIWLFAIAHDDASWFVRIVGVEFNLRRA